MRGFVYVEHRNISLVGNALVVILVVKYKEVHCRSIHASIVSVVI